MTTDIQLTPKQAKEFTSETGLYGFALAKKLKLRAKARATETKEPCSLVFKGEVLYTAQVLNEEK